MNGFFQRLLYATGCVFELARGIIIFAVVLALLNIFVATTNVVSGASMEPNFHDAQSIIIDKISYILRSPRRGEVVILKFPGDPEKTRYIKRVVGLPGEKISIIDDQVYINDKPILEPYIPDTFRTEPNLERQLGKNEYFVMGDNRENSNDSRVFGPVERRFMVGLAYFVLLPLRDAGLVPPEYYFVKPKVSPSPQ